ncbi:hypothetical protein K1719_046649 [Acacia pycnantha]|nr:hypothetical protein K1719_046649 [Acacia pycnantha]
MAESASGDSSNTTPPPESKPTAIKHKNWADEAEEEVPKETNNAPSYTNHGIFHFNTKAPQALCIRPTRELVCSGKFHAFHSLWKMWNIFQCSWISLCHGMPLAMTLDGFKDDSLRIMKDIERVNANYHEMECFVENAIWHKATVARNEAREK